MPLTFAQLVSLLKQPPYEPCESELHFLTNAEYEAAFNEVDRCYRRRLTRYIGHITGDLGRAEDLAQEVLNNIYRARASFERAYIYRAAKNAAFTEIHRAKRRHILEARWAGVRRYGDKGKPADKRPPLDPDRLMRTREEAVRRAVELLPEKFRVPLLLHAAGQSDQQIMELMRASEGAVRSRICRGKSILRRRLRAYLQQDVDRQGLGKSDTIKG
jgi:DNA-directed RNA polymerase specialized sigma24 family protein